MMEAWIEAIGLYAPGLQGWENSRESLAGNYQPGLLSKYKPKLLPANECRRATNSVRIAFGACEDAIGERLEEASQLAAVFASSGGDYGVHDQICRALLRDEIAVSPTHFHNSVHNAAAGYWSIASGSRAPSVSVSAHDFSVAAGLLEALPIVGLEKHPTLLVCSDCEVVATMHSKRPINNSFACALWLTPCKTGNSLASLNLQLAPGGGSETSCNDVSLEALRQDNPAARILPLLELLASRRSGQVVHPTAAGQSVEVTLASL